MLKIRHTLEADLPYLSEFWYDNMALLQQINRSVRLLPQARQRWEQSVQEYLDAPETVFLVAESGSELLGYVLGHITLNRPGLAPEKIGMIDSLVLDIHSPHKQGGASSALLQSAITYFTDNNITQLQVSVSAREPVSQAFWLSVGARKTDDILWIRL